jgi:hypothetical protein
VDEEKIRQITPDEFNRFFLQLKLLKWGLREFYFEVYRHLYMDSDSEKAISHEQRQMLLELYRKLCKRFHGKTGLELKLTNPIGVEVVWETNLLLDKKILKVYKCLRVI